MSNIDGSTPLFPSDWPGPGALDLTLHDLPHDSAATEWWYVNCHFELEGGRSLSLFASFFKIIRQIDELTGEVTYAYSVTWGVSDPGRKTYFAQSLVDKASPEVGLQKIAQNQASKDGRMNRALKEMLEQGQVPRPDRMFKGDVFVNPRRLELDFDGLTLCKNDAGAYRLHLFDGERKVGCDLTFHPRKPPTRHGDDGVVRGSAGEHMFYYFIPRCELTGTVTLDGVQRPLAHGQGWYDHEFGGHLKSQEEAQSPKNSAELPSAGAFHNAAWGWTAIQFEDGTDLSASSIIRCEDNVRIASWVIVVGPDGARTFYDEMQLEPLEWWTSTRTFASYPVKWRLQVPAAGLDVTITAAFEDQEFVTVISAPAFWEGRCLAEGTWNGRTVRGLSFIERSGFEELQDLDDFFTAVGVQVRKSVESIIPFEPTFEQARDLVASKERSHYMDGVDIPQLTRTLVAPVREITDRGGKSWRSYAALACCDVVGGDSRQFVHWLAMPEFMHVGSLIIDDIQDKSTVRRGGPTCHLVYGEPLAINAGTAAYFMGQKLLVGGQISDATKLRLYDLYFEALRAGHAGQAMDLDGAHDLMPHVVATGDADALEARVVATHRLKTAAPARALSSMGALVGGGSEAQVEGIGTFFEAVGLAFQIMDDVLNLRGFKGDLKIRGEDISKGTVTLPVAAAFGRLESAERLRLWEILQAQTTDLLLVSEAIELIERCGALDACVTRATQTVEESWQRINPLLEPSAVKIMLRAFGWYVLERHY